MPCEAPAAMARGEDRPDASAAVASPMPLRRPRSSSPRGSRSGRHRVSRRVRAVPRSTGPRCRDATARRRDPATERAPHGLPTTACRCTRRCAARRWRRHRRSAGRRLRVPIPASTPYSLDERRDFAVLERRSGVARTAAVGPVDPVHRHPEDELGVVGHRGGVFGDFLEPRQFVDPTRARGRPVHSPVQHEQVVRGDRQGRVVVHRGPAGHDVVVLGRDDRRQFVALFVQPAPRAP